MEYPQTLELAITQRDIDDGTPGCVAGCPIALAAQRAFPDHRAYMGRFNLELVHAGGVRPMDAVTYRAEHDAMWFRFQFDTALHRFDIVPATVHFTRYEPEGKRKR